MVLFLIFFKTEQLNENQKQSKDSVSRTLKKLQDLEVSTRKQGSISVCAYLILLCDRIRKRYFKNVRNHLWFTCQQLEDVLCLFDSQ